MIRFSTLDLMDELKCYVYLVAILHPEGLGCPACHTPVAHAKVHRRDRALLLSFRCACGRIYNALRQPCGKVLITAVVYRTDLAGHRPRGSHSASGARIGPRP